MHNCHVAYSWDQYEGVHRHIRGDVDEIVHQPAGKSAELPTLRAVLVSCERRDDDHKTQVGECEIQQQKVGDGSHLTLGQDDVDHQCIAGDAGHRDDAEQSGNDQLEQHEVEPTVSDWAGVGHGARHLAGVEHVEAADPLIHQFNAMATEHDTDLWLYTSHHNCLSATTCSVLLAAVVAAAAAAAACASALQAQTMIDLSKT